jgi:hypothetical protein
MYAKEKERSYLLPLLQVLPSGFLCLLGGLSITLAGFQSLLFSLLLLGFLLLLLVLCLLLLGSAQWLSSSRSTSLLGGSSGLLIGLDPLDSGIVGENIINKLSESGRIILLSPCSFRLVLFLGESLLISTVISAHAHYKRRKRDIRIRSLIGLFVVPFERPPTVKVVPSIVESFDFLLGSIVSTESRHGLGLGEPCLTGEDGCDGLAVFLGGNRLEVGDLVFNVPVDGIELTSSLGVGQCLVCCLLEVIVCRGERTHLSGYT